MSDLEIDIRINPENGMYIGPDELHYETLNDVMYYSVLGLCGCGRSEAIHAILIECLKATNENGTITHTEAQKVIIKHPEIITDFVLHFLDKKGLTEHGTSVDYSWITPLGEQFVKIGDSDE